MIRVFILFCVKGILLGLNVYIAVQNKQDFHKASSLACGYK